MGEILSAKHWPSVGTSVEGAKMLNLSIAEPKPEQTKAARIALEVYVALIPWDANALSWLAILLVSEYLNRWNECKDNPAAGKHLLYEAERRVDRALEINQDLPRAHYAKGLVLRANTRYPDAQKEFEKARTLDTTFAVAFAQEANEWINLGQFDKAFGLVTKAIDRDTFGNIAGLCHWVLGRAYFFKCEWSDAINHLSESVKVRDNLWHSQLYLVSAYANNKDLDNATRTLTDFRGNFEGFDAATLDLYQKDIPNSYLSFEKFRDGLRAAHF